VLPGDQSGVGVPSPAGMSQRFGPDVRLRAKRDFTTVQEQGRRIATRYVILLGHPNQCAVDRLGIIASRRFGNAVTRVRAKRRLREIFRRQSPSRSGSTLSLDLVAIPKRELLSAPFPQVRDDFVAAVSRMRLSKFGRHGAE
jgi:ribonuclease P protein component